MSIELVCVTAKEKMTLAEDPLLLLFSFFILAQERPDKRSFLQSRGRLHNP